SSSWQESNRFTNLRRARTRTRQIHIPKVKRRLEGKDLEKEFNAASDFVQACTLSVPDGLYLRFYGLHKIATEGPCTAPPPFPHKLKPHNEWNAWNNLGDMSPEEAMNEYIAAARELFPSWAQAYYTRMKDEETSASATGSKGPGPASKTNELELGEIHVSAREGEIEDLKKHMEAGVAVNTRDSRKRTPLHLAVDHGHLGAVELLVSSNADVDAQDDQGQTPLHYAVRREKEDIALLLVKHRADLQIKDGDGNTAPDLCSSAWPFLKPAN
uniref:ACB domain-containing protein n=1 Tax=Aegilops tauschii subsp. strangulata TaxID=200361 RepID=A0A453DH98_AEGTS